jgi:hypothetical protein
VQKRNYIKTLTLNCFQFTLGTKAKISDGTEIFIERIDAMHIHRAAREYGIKQVCLIGPTPITQRIMQELITEYGLFEVVSIPG